MKVKYGIKEVAELFNITTNKIRFYEKKGLITAARDEENNYDKDVKIDQGSLKIYKNYEVILDTVFKKATHNVDKQVEVLEIGVGTGNLANRFLSEGFHITG